MAPSANRLTSLTGRAVRLLRPTRRQLAVGIAVEGVTMLLGLPLPVHVVFAAAAHLLAGHPDPEP